MSTIESLSSINEIPTEEKLSKFFEEEMGDMIVMEICDELLKNVMDGLEAKYLESQAHHFIVECAIEAMKKAVEMNCYFHNISYSSMQKGSWECDIPCEPSQADSWAAYRVPLKYTTDMKEETERKTEEDEKDHFNLVGDATSRQLTTSSSSQSQDGSVTDIFEDLSTSDDEMHHPSWVNLNKEQQENKEDSDKESSGVNSGGNEKINPLDIEPVSSDEIAKRSEIRRETTAVSSTFSKTTVGEFEKGLCVPQVGNVPITNVVRELPGIEPYIYTRKERRGTKVVKPKAKILPRRRSDTNIKMIQVEEEPPKEKNAWQTKK